MPIGFIRNPIDQVRDTGLLGPFVESFFNLLFQYLGHPDQALDPSVSNEPFPLRDIILAVAHKTRGDRASSYRPCQGGEFHSAGGHAHIVPVHGHDAVAHGKDGGDALAATARRHGIIDQTVEVIVVDLLAGGLEDKIIDPFPLSQLGIEDLSLGNGLIGACGVDFKGRPCSPSSCKRRRVRFFPD